MTGKVLSKFLQTNQQIISYGIFGVLTTVINIASYQVLLLFVDYKISNLIAIILTKIVAYIVNKKFVFRTKCQSILELLKEMCRYTITRGLTGIIDYVGVIILVEFFHFNESYVKYLVQILVIVLNYIFGKKAVFVTGLVKKKEVKTKK